MSDLAHFREALMRWAEEDRRPLPWKGIRDPYRIWLSEILLQQTRVAQGRPYYEKFVARWPDVHALAGANDDELMKMWEGLGYYSRARNLLKAAREVVEVHGGIFPDNSAGLQTLPGIGVYTAAAIASFAYGEPVAVVDGNVYRILSRYMGISTSIDSDAGKKQIAVLAQQALDQQRPAAYNQAIMDFGALVCKPRQPGCGACPLSNQCQALAHGKVASFPVREKKPARRRRYFEYLVLGNEEQVWIRKRPAKDIWADLYEFPMVEQDHLNSTEAMLAATEAWQEICKGMAWQVRGVSAPYRQVLSHQEIVARFWDIRVEGSENYPTKIENMMVERQRLNKFAFPRIITQYLSSNKLSLNLF